MKLRITSLMLFGATLACGLPSQAQDGFGFVFPSAASGAYPCNDARFLQDQQRFANVKGAFAVNNAASVKGKNILLVDDVLSTGATCSEAAYALKDSGANIVFVLTLAN